MALRIQEAICDIRVSPDEDATVSLCPQMSGKKENSRAAEDNSNKKSCIYAFALSFF